MDMEKLASIFEAVKVMPLRKNDVVVFRTKDRIPQEAAKYLRETLESRLKGHLVLVLEGGADLDVIRREDLEEAA